MFLLLHGPVVQSGQDIAFARRGSGFKSQLQERMVYWQESPGRSIYLQYTMKFVRRIALTGLLSLLPAEITYAKPKSLRDDFIELAELAMKCPDKVSREEISYQQGKPVPYRVDIYKLSVPVIPDGNKLRGLSFPETVTFLFSEGNPEKVPNQVVDLDDHFEIIGGTAGYFGWYYQPLENISILNCEKSYLSDDYKARIRAAIKFIKENVSPNCYTNTKDLPLS